MSGKYFIFSITRPASGFCALAVLAQLLLVGFLVSSCNGIPLPDEVSSTSVPSTTVKILIPPSSSDDSEDDAIIIEAGNGTDSVLPKEPFNPNDCSLGKEKGPCRAIIDMWYFNTATKKCEQFQYSGCGGNGNRFAEETECSNQCGIHSEKDDDAKSDAIVIESGTVSGNGTCPKFDGCGPLKCAVIRDEKTGCQKCACSTLPADEDDDDEGKLPVGSVSGTPSEDDDKKVKNEKPEDICGLPEVRGDCRAMVTRYRYDSKTKTCIMFHFGGCNSNGNNFVSEEKCQQFCKGQ